MNVSAAMTGIEFAVTIAAPNCRLAAWLFSQRPMKYLAILKDSFREALDSKVMYVTMGLSAVLILLVGSLSFEPVPAQQGLESIVRDFNLVYADHNKSFHAEYFGFGHLRVLELKEDDDANTGQLGRFRFTLEVGHAKQFQRAVAFWDGPASRRLLENEAVMAATRERMEAFLKDQFALHGNVTVVSLTRDVTFESRPPAVAGAIAVGDPWTALIMFNERANDSPLRFRVQTEGSRGARGWLHDPCLFFGALPLRFLRSSLGSAVYFIETSVVGTIGGFVALMLGVIITAFFIPNMLHKGSVDLLLAKPVQRWLLLVYKYLGGLSFMFINTVVAIGGVWLMLGWRSGIWAPGFLVFIFILTFFFAILYAVSALMGVLTRSAIVSILVTVAVWFLCWLAGSIYSGLEMVRKTPGMGDEIPQWVHTTVHAVHAVLPRTADLSLISTRLVSDAVLTEGEIRRKRLDQLPSPDWGESFGVSMAFIAVMLGLACWRFSTRDY